MDQMVSKFWQKGNNLKREKGQKKVYCMSDVIKGLATKSDYFVYNVKALMDVLDDVLKDMLKEATEDCPVEVHLTKSIVITAYFTKATNRVNPNTLEHIRIPGKFRTVARFMGILKHVKEN